MLLIYAGQRITADALDALAPLMAMKAGDTNYTNTTLTNDPELFLALVANATYLLEAFLVYEGGTSGSADLQGKFTVPSGASLRYTNIGQNASGGNTGSFAGTATSGTYTGNTNGAGNLRSLTIPGSVVMGSTAGNIQMQFSQNTANATATIVHAQSYLAVQRVS